MSTFEIFEQRRQKEAIDFAARGGIAVHLHCFVFPRSPQCFRRAVQRGEYIAHLFGADKEQIVATAKKFGVRVIVVEYEGLPRQHIDLCGAPLRNLLEYLGRPERLLIQPPAPTQPKE